MAFRAKESVRTLTIHCSAIEQTQHTSYLVVKFLRSIFSFLYESLVCIGKIIVVICIGCTHGKTVRPCSKLKVKSILHSLVGVVRSTPIAHHHSVKLPILLQYLVEQYGIVTVVLVLIQIVCTHDSPRLSFCYGSFEGREIDLMESTVADNDIHLMAIFLVIIQGIMLYTCSNPL